MKIPIMNGVFTDKNSDFRISYPRNLIPVAQPHGISNGYLRPAEGIVPWVISSGVDRGGINWNGFCYRIAGQKLNLVNRDGLIVDLGSVGGQGQVTLAYSFDHLGIASSKKFYLWDGSGNLVQVTDPDLGDVIDFIWVDCYFMTTDGESLVVTDLNDPFSINPTHYASSEVDPDPVIALLKLHNEPYALNRYTIEPFTNIGGRGFPFVPIEGAQIDRGTIGTHACCIFLDRIAFLGSGKNEPPSVWLGANGQSSRLATREIDQILSEYSEEVLADVLIEPRFDKGNQRLYIHLPDQTLVYDATTSQATETPVWFKLTSGIDKTGQYLAKNMVWCYDKWIVGHPTDSKIGTLDYDISSHWGDVTTWEFGTLIIYNGANNAIFHELELICLPGRAILGDDPKISTSYSIDGEVWSMIKSVSAGKRGERNKKIRWFRQGTMQNFRIQRFQGTSDARISIAGLEARIEGMAF